MKCLSAAEGYRLWSTSYDSDPNPVVALEQRVLQSLLPIDSRSTVIDVATGTGRWLAYAVAQGGRAVGIDISEQMLRVASERRSIHGRLAIADIHRLPIADNTADLVICSFALGYIFDLRTIFCEMARIARRIIVSDLHPEAVAAGWTRSFRNSENDYELSHFRHSLSAIDESARAALLTPDWSIAARFDEPERPIFERAGRASAFALARRLPAVLISSWVRP